MTTRCLSASYAAKLRIKACCYSAAAAATPQPRANKRADIQEPFIREQEIPPEEYYPEGYHPQLLTDWPSDEDLVIPAELMPPQMLAGMGAAWRHRKAYTTSPLTHPPESCLNTQGRRDDLATGTLPERAPARPWRRHRRSSAMRRGLPQRACHLALPGL